MVDDGSTVDVLDDYGLLGPDILLSHATNPTNTDAQKLKTAKAWVSSTPETELQMGHGNPIAFQDAWHDISSLGVDCHSNNSSDMVSQMRLGLQSERGRRNEDLIRNGKSRRSLDLSVQDAFRLGTIQGARAIHMEDKLGSIEVGKLADLVIFDGTSPGMICAAQQDPVAAIVLHSSIRDIDSVIVDGMVRKDKGDLAAALIDPAIEALSIPRQVARWPQIARAVLASRKRVEKAIAEANADDFEHQVPATMKMFHVNGDKFD